MALKDTFSALFQSSPGDDRAAKEPGFFGKLNEWQLLGVCAVVAVTSLGLIILLSL